MKLCSCVVSGEEWRQSSLAVLPLVVVSAIVVDCIRVEGVRTDKENKTIREDDLADGNVYAGLSTRRTHDFSR